MSITLFKLFGIERIHIIGCSRSGTTLLHLAMGSFNGAQLAEIESGINYPYGLARLILTTRLGMRPGKKYFITKRPYSWFEPHRIAELIDRVPLENIGIIHIVRDPRDVMLSRLVGSARDAEGLAYVTPEHWHTSILAADRVFAALANYPRKLVVRYEDMVLDPGRVEKQIAASLGLERNPKAFPMDRVKDNFELLGIRFDPARLKKTGGLRNMEAKSVGKWRDKDVNPAADSMSAQIRAHYDTFCAEHGYL